MGKIITVHSSRGETGKSLIAVNLAAIYAHHIRSQRSSNVSKAINVRKKGNESFLRSLT